MILELRTGRIDDAGNFVCDDELKVLSANLIADKQPILDLDDAYEVIIRVLYVRLFIVYVPLRNLARILLLGLMLLHLLKLLIGGTLGEVLPSA